MKWFRGGPPRTVAQALLSALVVLAVVMLATELENHQGYGTAAEYGGIAAGFVLTVNLIRIGARRSDLFRTMPTGPAAERRRRLPEG